MKYYWLFIDIEYEEMSSNMMTVESMDLLKEIGFRDVCDGH